MPFYVRAGSVPAKRHTQFRNRDGGLYHEELFSTAGFSGISSLLYHVEPPAQATTFRALPPIEIKELTSTVLRPHAFDTNVLISSGDAVSSRLPMLYNDDVVISFGTPDQSMTDHFYRNAGADEMILVHEGTGVLHSPFGRLPFGPEELVLIPRGTTVQWQLDGGSARLLTLESVEPINVPRKLRNEYGQMLDHALFTERDVRVPELDEPIVETGAHPVHVQHGQNVTEIVMLQHPFGVVGWDGYVYPHAIKLSDFASITGSIHLMPDQYQAFGTSAAAICVIAPHLLDYHPQAVPAPPSHNNVDSDEVMFTVTGLVPGRSKSVAGSLTLHPKGHVHGPKEGTYERSIGVKSTDLTALMIDTFRPLKPTTNAVAVEVESYYREWLPK